VAIERSKKWGKEELTSTLSSKGAKWVRVLHIRQNRSSGRETFIRFERSTGGKSPARIRIPDFGRE